MLCTFAIPKVAILGICHFQVHVSLRFFLMRQIYLSGTYTARLVVENIHQKDTLYNEIGLCAQNMGAILGHFSKKEILHFDFLRLLHLTSNFET